MVITAQRRRIQVVVKPVKVRIDTRLKPNGIHTVAKSLRNLSKLILAEIRILQDKVILKIVINGKRRMVTTEPSKCPVGLFIGILYRTGVGVIIHTIGNTEALTFSSVPFKRIIRFSVNRTDLENGKINPRGLNLIPINGPLVITDVNTARDSAIGQSVISQRLGIDVAVARIDKHAVFETPRVRFQRVRFAGIHLSGIIG